MISKTTILNHTGFINHNDITDIVNEFLNSSKTMDISSSLARKVVVLIIEILENSYYYTKNIRHLLPENIDQPYFSITFSENKFKIISVNPIKLEHTESLNQRIKEINKCNARFLRELYLKKLTESIGNNMSSPGVGLIRLAKITKNKINCSFTQFNNKFLNYTLEIIVNSK